MATRALQPAMPIAVASPYRPNILLAWLYKLFFARIEVDPAWARAVRDASARGTVVYVMRSVSYLDFVALDFFSKKFSLPLIRFVTDLGLWILEPFRTGLMRLFARREPPWPALERAVTEGFSALLFMRKPQAATALKRRGTRNDEDEVRVLIAQQRRQDRPILLFPQVFVWGKGPDRLHKGVVDQIFGPQEYPGRLRVVAQLFWNLGHAELRACEPLDLATFLAEHADLDDDALVNKIHWLLVTRLDRERRVVLGPVAKGPDRVKQEILRNPRIREAVAETARREKKSTEIVERTLRRDLDRLEARLNPVVLRWIDRLLNRVFNRIYQGIEVDAEGLQRVREAARRGPVILLPSHKSHLDYLLLSYVFYNNGLSCPAIAAGDNLAFWPIGWILRRCGAFFIRRSFNGARLYTTLVDTYVRKLLKEGYAIEFFVEGGRSRSGKLLAPKAGLLAMVADAADAAGTECAYVPIAIGYEKIVEQGSYVHELSGGEKRKEDAGALLSRAPRVLTAKYGRAYVQFGEILHFGYSARPGDARESETPATARAAKRAALEKMHARRNEVQALAQRVAYEINRATPVTPGALVATALLGARRRGLPRADLLAAIDALVTDLRASGARFASSLAVGPVEGSRPYRLDAIEQALNNFIEEALLTVHGDEANAIYRVVEDRRLALDFYKNNVIHFFVPRALMALAVLRAPGALVGCSRDELRDRVHSLAQMFEHEFQFRSEADAEFADTLARFVASGVLVPSDDGSHVRAPDDAAVERLDLYAGLLRNFVESARIAAHTLPLLLGAPIPARELLARSLAVGERMVLTGEVVRKEAVSKPNLESAFAAFRDAGILVGGDGGPQRIAASHASAEALRAIEARFTAYL